MKPIHKLTVSGFRGILSPLEILFSKGSAPTSVVIYGRNGTGKSSITDAWEWLLTGRIKRLAREGAGEAAYPHRNAGDGDTFVEVAFSDPNLDVVRLTFDQSRIRSPIAEGNRRALQELAPHPCQIRFSDLTEFVYSTKADRYDDLARLMGFTPQVELQKALRRTLRRLSDELASRQGKQESMADDLKTLLEPRELTNKAILSRLNEAFSRHDLPRASGWDQAETSLASLKKHVEDDPRAKELNEISKLERVCKKRIAFEALWERIEAFEKSARELRDRAGRIADLPLVDLYGKARQVLQQRLSENSTTGECPVCRQPIDEPKLIAHLEAELGRLEKLKQTRDGLVTARDELKSLVGELVKTLSEIVEQTSQVDLPSEEWSTKDFTESAQKVQGALTAFAPTLDLPLRQLPQAMAGTLAAKVQETQEIASSHERLQSSILQKVRLHHKTSKVGDRRTELVEDYSLVRDGLRTWGNWKDALIAATRLESLLQRFERIVDTFIEDSVADVERRFTSISADVDRFFGVLEAHQNYIGSPALRLLRDQERAVILEVEFRGETVAPAYRLLSESQLNSFGLAAFLASAKHFNPEFQFIILDDVINSFDAYKRPQVIRLLKEEFPDHQFLVMTHDSTWAMKLFEQFPRWVRKRFSRYEATGPVVEEGFSDLEKIQHLIDRDEADKAGLNLGPFLERQLQELSEAFEVLVKYNQRNEYTLAPLLERFRVRVSRKLGKSHPLTDAVEKLEDEQAFRNLCAHWKNPEIPFSPEEIQVVVDLWRSIERLVKCQDEGCFGFVRYKGGGRFVCRCGGTVLGEN